MFSSPPVPFSFPISLLFFSVSTTVFVDDLEDERDRDRVRFCQGIYYIMYICF